MDYEIIVKVTKTYKTTAWADEDELEIVAQNFNPHCEFSRSLVTNTEYELVSHRPMEDEDFEFWSALDKRVGSVEE